MPYSAQTYTLEYQRKREIWQFSIKRYLLIICLEADEESKLLNICINCTLNS